MDDIECLLSIASRMSYLDIVTEGSPEYRCEAFRQSMSKMYQTLSLNNFKTVYANSYMFAMKEDPESRIIVAITGTNKLDLSDLWNDFLIFINELPSRVKCVQELVENLINEHPNSRILLTGHSLGGTLAELVAVELYKKYRTEQFFCVSFNAACPFKPLLCLLDRTGPWGDSAQGPSGS